MTDEFDDMISADMAEVERRIIDLMVAVDHINQELRPLEKAKKQSHEEIKQYMGLSNLTTLRDAETGVTAKLQFRAGTPTYDVMSCVATEEGQQALIKAANAGMVRIDNTMLTAFRSNSGSGWADLINKYKMPGTGTEAVTITKEDN